MMAAEVAYWKGADWLALALPVTLTIFRAGLATLDCPDSPSVPLLSPDWLLFLNRDSTPPSIGLGFEMGLTEGEPASGTGKTLPSFSAFARSKWAFLASRLSGWSAGRRVPVTRPVLSRKFCSREVDVDV